MLLRRFNLNLLPMLHALLETQNLTRAGERLGLTQSTMSAALTRLRATFNDDLLVHIGRQMVLTPYAEELREPIARQMRELEETFSRARFEPSSWRGDFIIASVDYVVHLLMGGLLKLTAKQAPDAMVRVVTLGRATLNLMRDDAVDLAIAPATIINDPVLASEPLFQDRFVCIHAKGRSPAQGLSELANYLEERHITAQMDGTIAGPILSGFSTAIDDLRAKQKNLAAVPYYSALPFLVEELGCVALVHERLARKLQRWLPIEICEPPVEISPLEVHMIWNPRHSSDPAHLWMRRLIQDAATEHLR